MGNTAVLLAFSLHTRLRAASTWVLATVFVSLAVMSVATARYSNELLTKLADPAIVAALQSQLHPPTVADVWEQWLKNLTQIGSLVMVLVAAATLQPAAGPAALILTRGVSRRTYLGAQVAGFVTASLTVAITAAAALWLGAGVVFGATNPLPILAATLIWWVQASCFVLVALWAAAHFGSVGASAGTGFGAFLLASLLTSWPPARTYSPAGLSELAQRVALDQPITAVSWWALVVSTLICALCWAAAAATFARREL